MCAEKQPAWAATIKKADYTISGPPITVIGTGRYAARAVRELLDEGVNVTTVISSEDEITKMAGIAKMVSSSGTIERDLERSGGEFFLSFFNPIIFDEGSINQYGGQLVNLHPSYLPEGKGRDPFTAQVEGKTQGAVSLHYVEKEIDGGEVISQVKYDIPGGHTRGNYIDKSIIYGIELFKGFLDKEMQRR